MTAYPQRPSGLQALPLEPPEALPDADPAGDGAMAALLATADRVYGRISAALERVGVSYAGFRVLIELRAMEGAAPVLEEPRIDLAGSVARDVMDDLIADGLVEEGSVPVVGRRARARLTLEGAEVLAQAAAAVESIAMSFYGSLEAAEREELDDLVARVVRTRERRGEPSPSDAISGERGR